MTTRCVRRLAMILLLACVPAVQAAQVPLKDFARLAQYTDVQISPDGHYLAIKVPEEDRTSAVIMRVADHKITGALRLESGQHVYRFWWKANNRLLASLAMEDGSFAQPLLTGELVAINSDGSGYKYLYGFRGDSRATRISGNDTAHSGDAFMIDPLVDDPSEALVSIHTWWGTAQTIAERINVYTGALKVVAVSPMPEGQSEDFLADGNGLLRYVSGLDDQYRTQTYRRDIDGDRWVKLDADSFGADAVIPLKVSEDGKSVFLDRTSDDRPDCLVEQTLETATVRDVLCDPTGDLDSVLESFDGKSLIGAMFQPGLPGYQFMTPPHGEQAILQGFAQSFPGQFTVPVSHSRDGKLVVLKVYSDHNPGDFYLYNCDTHRADYLLSEREWIDPDQMSDVKAVEWKARDGTMVHGYLTLPRGKKPEKLPMVVNPHGGPFNIRDSWEWNPDTQALASRGYAVLQVNFRGSAGYGATFRKQGRQQWGGLMIDDITDGVKWAVSTGYADASRLCIYGGSYGGYAAMMSAVREPDLYRCVVAYAGVYDLNLWKRDTDVDDYKLGRTYIEKYIAPTSEERTRQSPLTYIDKLKAAVLIVHGKDDERVPFTQAKALADALDEHHFPYETLYKGGEGHGFYKVENRLEMYEKMLAFLDRNIGNSEAADKTASTGHGG